MAGYCPYTRENRKRPKASLAKEAKTIMGFLYGMSVTFFRGKQLAASSRQDNSHLARLSSQSKWNIRFALDELGRR